MVLPCFFESINVVQLCAIDDYHAIYGDARLSYHIELKSLKQLQIKSFRFSTLFWGYPHPGREESHPGHWALIFNRTVA